MSRLCIYLACLVLQPSTLVYATAADSQEELSSAETEAAGVKLTVSVPAKTELGQPLPLKVRLKNLSDAVIYSRIVNGVDVENVNTREKCIKTMLGKSSFGETFVAHRFCRGFVKPEKEGGWEIDLAKCVELGEGDYELTLSIKTIVIGQRERGEVTTGPIKFSVVRKTDGD